MAASEGDRVFLEIDDDFFDNLLRQASTLNSHVVVGGIDDARQRPQGRLPDSLVFVFD